MYTSGVDQRVAEFALVNVQTGSSNRAASSKHSVSRWVQTSVRRLHAHDVRALAIWPHLPLSPSSGPSSSSSPVLISGGLDMSVTLTPCAPPVPSAAKMVNILATSKSASFTDSYHRRMAYVGRNVSVCRSKRWLVCRKDDGISIWRIEERRRKDEDDDEEESEGYEKVLEMELSTRTNLTSCAVSDDGRWLAVADLEDVKLFELLEDSKSHAVRPKKVMGFGPFVSSQLPSSRASSVGATALCFTPDSSQLVLCTAPEAGSDVVVISLNPASAPVVTARFGEHREKRGGDRAIAGRAWEDLANSGKRGSWIGHVTVSADGKRVATADVDGRCHVFDISKSQVSHFQLFDCFSLD